MRTAGMFLLFTVLLTAGGCALLDSALGVGTTDDGAVYTKEAPIKGVAGLLDGILGLGGLASGAAGVLTGLYQRARKKEYASAGGSLARGVAELLNHVEKDNSIGKEEALAIIKAIQNRDDTRGTVNRILKENKL